MSIFDRLTRLARSEWSHARSPDPPAGQRPPDDPLAEILSELPGGAPDERGASAEGSHDEYVELGDPPGPSADPDRAPGPRTPGTRSGPQAVYTREIRQAYAALEVRLGAERDEVRAAYRALLKRHHPDRHDDDGPRERAATERTLQIREAWQRLDSWLP